jgi:pseudouridine-5'-phosphate glycosidase
LLQSVWNHRPCQRQLINFGKFIRKCARSSTFGGQASTPYLLRAVAEFTQGATVVANEKLLLANAKLAAQVALELIEKQAQA